VSRYDLPKGSSSSTKTLSGLQTLILFGVMLGWSLLVILFWSWLIMLAVGIWYPLAFYPGACILGLGAFVTLPNPRFIKGIASVIASLFPEVQK